jgi:plastocyanin
MAAAIAAAGALLVACGTGTAGPGWTFMPPGPTPVETPGASPTPGEPNGSPGNGTPGPGELVFDVETPPDDQLAFVPDTFSAPPGATITVNYLNDTNIPHNIHFFEGPDQNAPSLGATEQVTGPGALETVTITAPDEPGDYYFHCDVHPVVMAGSLTVEP